MSYLHCEFQVTKNSKRCCFCFLRRHCASFAVVVAVASASAVTVAAASSSSSHMTGIAFNERWPGLHIEELGKFFEALNKISMIVRTNTLTGAIAEVGLICYKDQLGKVLFFSHLIFCSLTNEQKINWSPLIPCLYWIIVLLNDRFMVLPVIFFGSFLEIRFTVRDEKEHISWQLSLMTSLLLGSRLFLASEFLIKGLKRWTFASLTIYFGLGSCLSLYGCYQHHKKASGG